MHFTVAMHILTVISCIRLYVVILRFLYTWLIGCSIYIILNSLQCASFGKLVHESTQLLAFMVSNLPSYAWAVVCKDVTGLQLIKIYKALSRYVCTYVIVLFMIYHVCRMIGHIKLNKNLLKYLSWRAQVCYSHLLVCNSHPQLFCFETAFNW